MKQLIKNGVTYFQFSSLPDDGIQQHAIFSRLGGVSPAPYDSLNMSISVPDDNENVYENRIRALGLFGRTTETTVHAHLVHGNKVMRVTREYDGDAPGRCDAIITNQPNCAMTMNFADCTPILVYDPINRAIGLGHAGWKGTVLDLPGALVEAMIAEFGSQPHQLFAGVGPCIGSCCYEVGEPVISEVLASFEDGNSLLIPTDGPRPHFDLPTANQRNLQHAGVQNIELSGLCTACRTDLFFSHRAEQGRTGRFGSIFMLNRND